MLKNEFYELDPLTSIVVSYEEIPPLDPYNDVAYQATVRYITTRKCLTVKSVQTLSVTRVKQIAWAIVAEMRVEYQQRN